MLDKFRRRKRDFYFDMEPFEIVRDMAEELQPVPQPSVALHR